MVGWHQQDGQKGFPVHVPLQNHPSTRENTSWEPKGFIQVKDHNPRGAQTWEQVPEGGRKAGPSPIPPASSGGPADACLWAGGWSDSLAQVTPKNSAAGLAPAPPASKDPQHSEALQRPGHTLLMGPSPTVTQAQGLPSTGLLPGARQGLGRWEAGQKV